MKFKKFLDVKTPTRNNVTDAGLDIYVPETVVLKARTTTLIPLGIGIELEPFQMAQVIERSSVAKNGIIMGKAPIDSGYRGQIHAIAINTSDNDIIFMKDDRIAQLVVSKIELPGLEEVKELSVSPRGDKAFGSSGK